MMSGRRVTIGGQVFARVDAYARGRDASVRQILEEAIILGIEEMETLRPLDCPECGSRAYIHDWGCQSCGLGNPFRGIACLTPDAPTMPPRPEHTPTEREG